MTLDTLDILGLIKDTKIDFLQGIIDELDSKTSYNKIDLKVQSLIEEH